MPELIDTGDIARLLGVTREHVADRLTKRPDFPAPAVVLSRKLRRWDAEEVRAWLTQAGQRSARPSPGNTTRAKS